jgi:hypothetical protein
VKGSSKISGPEGRPVVTPDHADLDDRLARLDPLIERAASALRTFSPPRVDAFLRESLAELPDDPRTVVSVTATARAFFALFEYLRMNAENRRLTAAHVEIAAKLARIADTVLSDREAMAWSVNDRNMFTASQFLLAASVVQNLQPLTEQAVAKIDRILEAAAEIAEMSAVDVEAWRGGRMAEKDVVHDFITLHIVRGIDAFRRSTGSRWQFPLALAQRVRDDVIRQLGFREGGMQHRFDPAELIFSVVLLNRTDLPEVSRLTKRALENVSELQTEDGAWTTARVISYRADKLLHVPSHEVALALSGLLIRDLAAGGTGLAPIVTPMLDKSIALVEATYEKTTEPPGFAGWANDRAQSDGTVESWVTAVVLTFLLQYREALLLRAQNDILAKYRRRVDPASPPEHEWPDLAPALAKTGTLLSANRPVSDPTRAGNLVERLEQKFLEPVVKSVVRKPRKTSLLLYGPPGTRKTTFVASIAQRLGWPMLTLTPPDFLKFGGLEGFEKAADEIFEDLMRLRRVVVLFDECEDFFKRRTADARTETRTVGAFITAGMLPRLQDLHDRGWVIFVLATNAEPDELDPAVQRPGRFDFLLKLDHPPLAAQLRYLRRGGSGERVASAVHALADESQPELRVPFKVLDDLVAFADERKDASVEDLVNELRNRLQRDAPPRMA